MTVVTVGDLARDLKVKNEDLLQQLATMGFEVEGPDSEVDAGEAAELKEKLVEVLPRQEVVEKRIKPTVIRRRVRKKSSAEGKAKQALDDAAYDAEEPPDTEEAQEERVTSKGPQERKTKEKSKAKTGAKKTAKARIVEPAKIIEKPRAAEPEVKAEKKVEPKKAAKKPEPEEKGVQEKGGKVGKPREEAETEPLKTSGQPDAAEAREEIQEAPTEAAETEEETHAEAEAPSDQDKSAKKKKKKDKKMQPAQIIGRVELKPEPQAPAPQKPERPERPSRPESPPAGRKMAPKPATGKEEPAVAPFEIAPTPDAERRKKKKGKKSRDRSDEASDSARQNVRRRKEVLFHKDLYDGPSRGGRLKTKKKKPKQRQTEVTVPKASKRRIKVPEVITVANLAHKMSVKSAELVQQLLGMGVTASLNEGVDYDTAALVASEFGYEVEPVEQDETALMPATGQDSEENLVARPPVITVMGHVDHGKTSLLDMIRSSSVTDGEAGGITQHIGAYKVRLPRGEIVFLDTPGHEAFTAMRARGAEVTDFVVLVVAADDGVMEQTREAINHAQAANVPIVVAVNKIDKPGADRDRPARELSDMGLIPEAWGGDTLFTYVSAKTGEGIDEFLEAILLQSEVMELKANPDKPATGTIVEARLDKGKGPVATVLVREGTLRLGDPFVAGVNHGKVRAMIDHEGQSVETGAPSTPVEVQGFSSVPEAGDLFSVVSEEKVARQIGTQRQVKQREKESRGAGPGGASLEDLLARMSAGDVEELNLILKADVQGSVEALTESLMSIPSEKVRIKVIHSGVGTVTESDVMLAAASQATVIGFNVRPTPKTSQLAEERGVNIRVYTVIYEVIEDVRKAMEGLLAPIEKEVVTGRAEVREVFHISRIGVIAGCYVKSGKIERSNRVRLLRDNVEIYDGKIGSMKRFKEDVKEALEGFECGIGLENYRDIRVGDEIEAYTVEKESATL
jgi:translation initiation factor IF-2